MSGKITVTNFSENNISVNITPNNQPAVVPVASGTVNIAQTSGFAVSGYNLYQVNFFVFYPDVISARHIVPDAIVEIAITNTTTDGDPAK